MNNNKRGIAVMSLVTTVAIILILLTTVTMSGINTAHNAKKIAFGAEIKMIQSAVDSYYTQNNATFPVKEQAYTIDFSSDNVSSKNKKIFQDNEVDDKTSFVVYEIDYEKIGITDLVYGNKKQGENEDKKKEDIYVVSRNSGKVYYLKGLKIGSEVYYTVTDDIENLLSYNNEKNTVNSPVIKFIPSTTDWTHNDVTIKVNVPTTSTYELESYNFNGALTTVNNDKEITVTVGENGTLVVNYKEDANSENSKEAKYIVSNIDKESPEIEIDKDKLIEISSRGDLGYIKITEKSDNLSGIKYLKYDYGEYDKPSVVEHFHASGKEVKENLVFFRSFTENITIYAEDKAGNYTTLNITPSGEIKKEDGSVEPEIPEDAKVYPYVPKGFSKVESNEEWTPTSQQVVLGGKTYYKARGWNNGLVIQNDSNGDQFVWVPVEIDEEYRNEISEDPANIKLTGFPKVSSSEYTEPVDFSSVGDLTKYRSMKSSIIRYGGFYVARYKARKIDGEFRITGAGDAAKERFTNYTYEKSEGVNINYVEWSLVKAISKYQSEEYSYSLIFGIQWDRIVSWRWK